VPVHGEVHGVSVDEFARGDAEMVFEPQHVVRRQQDVDVLATLVEAGDALWQRNRNLSASPSCTGVIGLAGIGLSGVLLISDLQKSWAALRALRKRKPPQNKKARELYTPGLSNLLLLLN